MLTASNQRTVGALGFIVLIVTLIIFGAYLAYVIAPGTSSSTTTTTSSSETTSVMSGVVVGYVTVSPSQPNCTQNQTCTVDLTGYSLEFTLQCTSSSTSCQSATTSLAQFGPNGQYSILLPAGYYLISGLSPSCPWLGCSSAFPKSVVVQGGMQISVDVNIDTGIR